MENKLSPENYEFINETIFEDSLSGSSSMTANPITFTYNKASTSYFNLGSNLTGIQMTFEYTLTKADGAVPTAAGEHDCTLVHNFWSKYFTGVKITLGGSIIEQISNAFPAWIDFLSGYYDEYAKHGLGVGWCPDSPKNYLVAADGAISSNDEAITGALAAASTATAATSATLATVKRGLANQGYLDRQNFYNYRANADALEDVKATRRVTIFIPLNTMTVSARKMDLDLSNLDVQIDLSTDSKNGVPQMYFGALGRMNVVLKDIKFLIHTYQPTPASSTALDSIYKGGFEMIINRGDVLEQLDNAGNLSSETIKHTVINKPLVIGLLFQRSFRKKKSAAENTYGFINSGRNDHCFFKRVQIRARDQIIPSLQGPDANFLENSYYSLFNTYQDAVKKMNGYCLPVDSYTWKNVTPLFIYDLKKAVSATGKNTTMPVDITYYRDGNVGNVDANYQNVTGVDAAVDKKKYDRYAMFIYYTHNIHYEPFCCSDLTFMA